MKLRVAPTSVAGVLSLDLSATAAAGSSLTAIGLATRIAPVGQAWTQASHSVQEPESILATPSTRELEF
jgi:hypothetical protein